MIGRVVKPILLPMIVVIIILFSNYLLTKDTFTFVKPKIEQEYSEYIKVREDNDELSLYELYNKFPEIPVYKLISIDIITTSPFSLELTISSTVSKYYSSIEFNNTDKELLMKNVSDEIEKLNRKNSEIRNLFFISIFIGLLLISLIISYFFNVHLKDKKSKLKN